MTELLVLLGFLYTGILGYYYVKKFDTFLASGNWCPDNVEDTKHTTG